MTRQEKKMKKNLLAAIDLARNHGSCIYELEGEPQCVIAQLATLEGVSARSLATWDKHIGATRISCILEEKPPGAVKLSHYDSRFLQELQNFWDRAKDDYSEPLARKVMRAYVEENFRFKKT